MSDGIPVPKIENYYGGTFVPVLSQRYLDVLDPASNRTIAHVGLSEVDDVNAAVASAKQAFVEWSNLTIKARAAYMLKLHGLIRDHAQELAQLIVAENGKNLTEALADVAKGNETVEYACSLPQLASGNLLQVSGGNNVTCYDRRVPLGVVTSIVPFNFPFMVPMWTIPIALVMGNTIILKPSEKVPCTMHKVASLFEQAGFPPGVFNMLQGTSNVVNSLIAHPDVKAVTFVGSTPVAALVASACHQLHKRCNALGGAKNHLVALPDCCCDDVVMESTAADIVVSFAGCAGQRCMAASVLLLVGEQDQLVESIVRQASEIERGRDPKQMGPVIDEMSYNKIVSYIGAAEKDGAKLLLDGRSWKSELGYWIGPTIIRHASSSDKTMREEVFGPVLSIFVCSSWEEAIAIENASPFGNAASIYTTNGANADWFLARFRAGMLGVNIGIPVPREPFSFGGLYGTCSKYGDMDITGAGGMEFFSTRIKVTSKWPLQRLASSVVTNGSTSGTKRKLDSNGDAANFAGTM